MTPGTHWVDRSAVVDLVDSATGKTLAVVTYTEEPSPETGHVGWCWWARGKMGEAPTRGAACAAVVAELARGE